MKTHRHRKKRRRVFDGIKQTVNDALDIRRANALRANAEHVANTVRAEGPAGALQVFNDAVLDEFERKVDNDRIWDEAYAKTADASNYGLIQQELSRAAAENADAWRRTNASNAAKIQGVIEGLGLDDDFKRDFIKNTVEQNDTMEAFFKEKNDAYDKFMRTIFDSPEERGLERAKLDTEFNDKYRVAQQHVAGIQSMQDEAFANQFWKTSPDGEAGYASALNWRKGVAQMTQDMLASVSQFRDSLVGKPFSERQAAWEQYKPQYLQMWRDRATANLEGSTRFINRVSSRRKC